MGSENNGYYAYCSMVFKIVVWIIFDYSGSRIKHNYGGVKYRSKSSEVL